MRVLVLSCILLAASFAHANTFGPFKGSYKIISCENQSTRPMEEDQNLCDATNLSIEVLEYYSGINFFMPGENGAEKTRTFGFPPVSGMGKDSIYEENPDEVKYFRDTAGFATFTRLRKIDGNTVHLSIYNESRFDHQEDLFEVELEKISEESKPVPIVVSGGHCTCCD